MAKLIVLALAFTALVAFASAHSTIVSTTLIEEENPSQQQQQQCSQQIQGERVNQCQRYLQQGQSWFDNRSQQQQQQGDLQSCCQELQNFQGQCQCEAVQEAFRQAAQRVIQQQGQQQQQPPASQQIRQLMQKAQNLPNQCSLQTRQCQVGPVSITTTTTTTITNPQQMCQHIRQRQFNQCQNYVQQQQRGFLLMSINRQGQQQQQQGLQQCCNELQNVEQQCQCEALQEVYRQAQQQQMQQQQRGGQTQDLQQIVQNIRNQCNLQAQQCQIPSAVF